MSIIKDLQAYEILDSRGFPTVEAVITLDSGHRGSGRVPSGASTGSKEALELRDAEQAFLGKGVKKAVHNIKTEIKAALIGQSTLEQKKIDTILTELDGTQNKSRLGANALLAVSMAAARASSNFNQQPLYVYLQSLYASSSSSLSLPMPMINIINGGAHADNNLDIQEFMIVPIGANSMYEALRYAVEIFITLKHKLKKLGLNTNVGDEGGFAPDLKYNAEAIELILAAIEAAGFTPGKDVALALDIAANELYKDGKYILNAENKSMTNIELIDFIESWVNNYPIISVEDALEEKDWHGWQILTKRLGDRLQIVGDDLFVTNSTQLNEGITKKAANAVLIKMNQIGTLSETFATIKLAKDYNFNTIISHRSGETEDTFIADLAVAVNAGQIKTGSVCRSDRVAKYNQLLRIEHSLAGKIALAKIG